MEEDKEFTGKLLDKIEKLESVIEQNDITLRYACQRLEIIETFSKGEWESKATRMRINKALDRAREFERYQPVPDSLLTKEERESNGNG